MRITMRAQISGTRNGQDWPAPGNTIDLPDDEAQTLIAQHMAVPAKDGGDVETATVHPDLQPETATPPAVDVKTGTVPVADGTEKAATKTAPTRKS